MITTHKELYKNPTTDVVEMKMEAGILTLSDPKPLDNPTDYFDGGDPF